MAEQGDLYAALFAAPGGDDDGPRGTVHRETVGPDGRRRGIDVAGDRVAELSGARERSRLHFYRCGDCLSVLAVDTRERELACGACGGRLSFMGTAGKDPKRLTRTHTESVCDDRCTSARGPHCECKCGGLNHGSQRHVVIVRDLGAVPTATLASAREMAQAQARAEEYRAAMASARARVARFDDALSRKAGGEYLSGADFGLYLEGRRVMRALWKADEARTHKGRLAKLAKVGV